MTGMLIAAAIDLDGTSRFEGGERAFLSSLSHGLGGQVSSTKIEGNILASRGAAGCEAASSVPYVGEDGWITLLAGRIQERADALDRFNLPKTATDAAIYAAAQTLHGDGCDAQLIGNYAVIQWHSERRVLRLARSPLSMQPLHVWRDGHTIVASSIPRTLIAMGLTPSIDEVKLADSLLLNFSDKTRSWYSGAHRIAAGMWERHSRDQSAQRRQYWSIGAIPPVRLGDDEAYVCAVDEQFRRAVRAEIHGIERPAIMLSGGLDSQAVAAFMAQEKGAHFPIKSFTSVPQGGWIEPIKPYSFGDEAPHVRALAEQYPQINTHFVSGWDRAFGQDMQSLMQLGGWPMRNESNLHWMHEAHQQAGAMGCDAIFFGGAGNSGFSYDGETGYATWLRRGQWLRLLKELGASQGDDRSILRKLAALAVLPNLPFSWQVAVQHRRGKLDDPFSSWCPLSRSYALESGAIERARADGFDPFFASFPDATSWREAVLGDMLCEGAEIELAFQLRYGVPSRDPTLFQPLVELTASIPDEQYLRRGVDRWLARRLLKGHVPERVRTERRFGRQSPDWAMRFQRDRKVMLSELESIKADGQLNRMLDIDRLQRDLHEWPGDEDTPGIWKQKINAAVSRAVSTARFVRHVEGRNVGS